MAKKAKQPRRITAKAVQAVENKAAPLPKIEHKPDIDNDPADAEGLTIRQRLFVMAITGPDIANATAAAERAGYQADNRDSLKVTASRLLTYANVQRAIATELGKKASSPEWAENRAFYHARADMANFLSVDDTGEPRFDWAKAAASGAIGHVREYKEDGIDGDGGPAVIKRSFKLIDPQKALETVLRLHGKLKDVTKHEGNVGFHPITLDGDKTAADDSD